MTTPTGEPLWLRTNDHETYGGHLSKVNFMSQGAIDPTTDVTAEQFARLTEDVAQLGRVAEFSVLTATCSDSSPSAPTINAIEQLAGSSPTPSRNGNGDVTFVWADSYTDAYSVSGSVHIMHAEATLHGATGGTAPCVVDDSDADGLNDRVRVRCFDSAGSAISNAKFTLTIWTSTAP